MSSYSFGTSDAAAQRLAMVSEIFDPPSRAFLRSVLPVPVALAVDVGCGPGNTTALLSAFARETVGLDASPDFVSRARARRPDLRFEVHDVTTTPLPVASPDVIYARLVLAHLRDPNAAVAAWTSCLAPGGALLIDEVAGIDTTDPALAEYLAVVVGLVASRGADMYAGRAFASSLRELPVSASTAAAMFQLNLSVWRDDPWVVENVPDVDGLARALGQVTDSASITWHLAQAVIRRAV